jgi:hypothetical protein
LAVICIEVSRQTKSRDNRRQVRGVEDEKDGAKYGTLGDTTDKIRY